MKTIIHCAKGTLCTCNPDVKKPFAIPRSCRHATTSAATPMLPSERLAETMRQAGAPQPEQPHGIDSELMAMMQGRIVLAAPEPEPAPALAMLVQSAEMLLDCIEARPALRTDGDLTACAMQLSAVVLAIKLGAKP